MSAQADMLHYETQAQENGLRFILGVDEAGRGPLAGPVVAAAVCLRQRQFRSSINDSKKMTPKSRLAAFHEVFDNGYVGIGMIGENAIDRVNILNASQLAMEIAIKKLIFAMPKEIVSLQGFPKQVGLLIDGNIFRPKFPYYHRTIIGGDAKSLSIACASIIAKVYRDRVLDIYDRIFPQYGFAKHKGYPTESHRQAIKIHGVSIIHRKTFQGVI